MPWAAWRSVAGRTWKEASDDNIGLIAAGVAFYGFLALVPLLSAIVLSYGIVADPSTVVRHVHALTSVMPRDVARAIGDLLMTVVEGADGPKGVGIMVAIAIALFGARNGAGALITALNIAYDEPEKRGFFRINLAALAITAAAAAAAILTIIAVAAFAAVAHLLPYTNDALLILGTVLSYVLLTLAGTAAAAALYRFAPCRAKPRWIWISPGSLLTGILWLALTLGFGGYVSNIAHYDATYGSLGAVVALLSWMYLSSYLLLFGAELNSECEHQAHLQGCEAPRPTAMENPASAIDSPGEPESASARADPPVHARTIARCKEHGCTVTRIVARGSRIAGLPQTGWVTSGMASLGLILLRRPGRTRVGLALVAGAAGISWLRPRR
jgi:membrane protein